VDNPDQRITDSVVAVTTKALGVLSDVLTRVVSTVVFVSVLYDASPLMFGATLAFCAADMSVTSCLVGPALQRIEARK